MASVRDAWRVGVNGGREPRRRLPAMPRIRTWLLICCLSYLPSDFSEEIASRPVTTDHSPRQRRACKLVFGVYCCSGGLPDYFWVGKFQCAGSAKFAPIP